MTAPTLAPRLIGRTSQFASLRVASRRSRGDARYAPPSLCSAAALAPLAAPQGAGQSAFGAAPSPTDMEGEHNTASPAPDLRGADRHAVDTPALLVDLDVLDANIARIAGTCRKHGIAWRPHTKGIKVPAIAHRLLAAGAIGVTCAKLGEAEVMAAAGIGDIMIANQIVGAQKIARLVDLRRRADVIVAVDNPDNVAALASGRRAVPA